MSPILPTIREPLRVCKGFPAYTIPSFVVCAVTKIQQTVSICSLCGQSRIIIVESSWLFIGCTIGPHHSRNRYQIASQTNFRIVSTRCLDLCRFTGIFQLESNRIGSRQHYQIIHCRTCTVHAILALFPLQHLLKSM
jgi:hypothetical protein